MEIYEIFTSIFRWDALPATQNSGETPVSKELNQDNLCMP